MHLCRNCLYIFLKRGAHPSFVPHFKTYWNICSFYEMKEVSGFAMHRSCNFEASEYFTGNGCGKPRKWHRQRCSGRHYIHRSGLPLLFFSSTILLLLLQWQGCKSLLSVFVTQQSPVAAVLAPSQPCLPTEHLFAVACQHQGSVQVSGSVWKSFIAYSHIPCGKVHTCILILQCRPLSCRLLFAFA